MIIHETTLTAFIEAIFRGAGCSPEEADRVARHLVAADLAGHSSHGVVRAIQYVVWLGDGRLVADHEAAVHVDHGPLVVLDGGFGLGQTIGHQAVAVGIERAREHGVAVVGLRHSGHLGRIADWAELAAAEGMVSIHFVNVAGKSLVAPFGAIDRRFGTDPVAVGIPQGDRPPILVDFATSVVAEGKARVALFGGPALPGNALVGPDGSATSDPSVLYGSSIDDGPLDPRQGPGALRAMGDQKGSALGLTCELLAGALIGSHLSGEDTFCNGMLSIYLSPHHFATDHFVDQAVAFADHVRAARPTDPDVPVVVPGDLERARAAHQRANGIDLAGGTWDQLIEAAAMVGVAVPAVP